MLVLTIPQPIPAQTLEEQTVIAALVLNTMRYTNWPKEVQAQMKDSISLCIVGDNVLQQSFSSIEGKQVGNKLLQVVNLSRLRNFEQCHALYLSEIKQNILLQVFLEIKKLPLLTIGEGSDFANQGGMIGLENVDGKFTMFINLPVVRESNLNISARLLALAKTIGN
jgi:hypothetical protein